MTRHQRRMTTTPASPTTPASSATRGFGALALLGGAALAMAMAAVATPAAVDTLDGPLPLSEGWWRLSVGPSGVREAEEMLGLSARPELAAKLPLEVEVDHKRFTVSANAEGALVLVVGRDVPDEDRGPFKQRRLRTTAYAARRTEPLADTVVFSSFRGRQYSDSPRALHEELVRRGAPLEHLWIVRDAACNVPDTARVLREGSREYYETLARTRYFVTNDHFPDWFARREDIARHWIEHHQSFGRTP